jgi:hypothetical protein
MSARPAAREMLIRFVGAAVYFVMHSTIDNNVGLGRQLSSFLGAASATGFGKEMDASGCSEAF